jgi:hypothetical protein
MAYPVLLLGVAALAISCSSDTQPPGGTSPLDAGSGKDASDTSPTTNDSKVVTDAQDGAPDTSIPVTPSCLDLNTVPQEELEELENAPGHYCLNITQEMVNEGPVILCPTTFQNVGLCARDLEGMVEIFGSENEEGETTFDFQDKGSIFFFRNASAAVKHLNLHGSFNAIRHEGGGSLAIDGITLSDSMIYFSSYSEEDNETPPGPDEDRSFTIRDSELSSTRNEGDTVLAFRDVADAEISGNTVTGFISLQRIQKYGNERPSILIRDNTVHGQIELTDAFDGRFSITGNEITPHVSGIVVGGTRATAGGGSLHGEIFDNQIIGGNGDFVLLTGIAIGNYVPLEGDNITIRNNVVTLPYGTAVQIEDSSDVSLIDNNLSRTDSNRNPEREWIGLRVFEDGLTMDVADIIVRTNQFVYNPHSRDLGESIVVDKAFVEGDLVPAGAVLYADNECVDITDLEVMDECQ